MTTTRDELRKLAENATPEPGQECGEWQTDGYAEYIVVDYEQDDDGDYGQVAEAANERLGAFIAAANPNMLLALLDQLDAAEAIILRQERYIEGLEAVDAVGLKARADQAEARIEAVEDVLDNPIQLAEWPEPLVPVSFIRRALEA